MAKGDPDDTQFEGQVAGDQICEFRGWVKDCQIAGDGGVTIKFGVYLPDKWDALKVTDIRERVVSVDIAFLKPRLAGGDRSHLDALRKMREQPSLSDVIDVEDVIDLTTALAPLNFPPPFIMSNGDHDGR